MSTTQVQVGVPASTSYASGTAPVMLGGKQADGIVSQLHSRYYTAALNGYMFRTSTAAAVTLPTTLATLASKFCLLNPAGSGRNIELVRLDAFINSATEVVNTIQLTTSTQTAAGLGTLTTGVISNCLLSGGTSQMTYYTAATHADTPVVWGNLIGVNATAVGLFYNTYNFEGQVIVPPGYCIDLRASVATQANFIADMVWIEAPL